MSIDSNKITIGVNDELLGWLNKEAKKRSLTRSSFIKIILNKEKEEQQNG